MCGLTLSDHTHVISSMKSLEKVYLDSYTGLSFHELSRMQRGAKSVHFWIWSRSAVTLFTTSWKRRAEDLVSAFYPWPTRLMIMWADMKFLSFSIIFVNLFRLFRTSRSRVVCRCWCGIEVHASWSRCTTWMMLFGILQIGTGYCCFRQSREYKRVAERTQNHCGG